ncbi:hypothetical protein KAR91_14735 [Candidatus Pacearchaeota archaeon]|nr:hypothetical protein [Candidatus Pacearchaeota archaeon]
MRLLYNIMDGKIFYAIPESRWFYFTHSTNLSLTEIEIDELAPDNKNLCIDLLKIIDKEDVTGDRKYKIDTGQLVEKEGWKEAENVL